MVVTVVRGPHGGGSSDFWPFFHGPPPILVKCLETNIRQIFFYLCQASSEV